MESSDSYNVLTPLQPHECTADSDADNFLVPTLCLCALRNVHLCSCGAIQIDRRIGTKILRKQEAKSYCIRIATFARIR